MREKITLEQLVASILANYKTNISFIELGDIVKEFETICDIYKEQQLISETFKFISKYIVNNNFKIALKDEYPLSTKICKDYNLKEALLFLAGESTNNFINYYITKGCINCNFDHCKILDDERNGKNEKGLPSGNDCIMWKNNHYRYKTLHKKNN